MRIDRSSDPEKYLKHNLNEDGTHRIYLIGNPLPKKVNHPFNPDDEVIVHGYSPDPNRPGKNIAQCSYPSSTDIHLVPDSHIEKPKIGRAGRTPDAVEREQIDRLNLQIEQIKKDRSITAIPYIQWHKSGLVSRHYIVRAEKVEGNPKADIRLVDDNGFHIYISHKAGRNSKDFQQFGGVSSERSHSAVVAAAKFIQTHYQGDMSKAPGTLSVKLDLSTEEDFGLVNRAVWGKEYDKDGHYGPENVHMLAQGDLDLKKYSTDEFVLTASGSLHFRGNLPSGDWQLAVSYRVARNFTAETPEGPLKVGGRAMIMLEAGRKAKVFAERPVVFQPNDNYKPNA